MPDAIVLQIEVPGEGYHRSLISCQVACPVHTDARHLPLAAAFARRAGPRSDVTVTQTSRLHSCDECLECGDE